MSADALMDRLTVPVTGDDLAGPFASRATAGPSWPRYGPRNLAFADGLDGWVIGGSSRAEVTGAHWDDYTVAAADGTATLSAAVPQPYGDVFVHQMWIAGEYRGATVTLADEETEEEQTFRIVGEDEADIRNGRLSVTSPLARALIGKGEGDSVEVSTPRGNKSYEIVTMSFSPKPAPAARKRGKARAAR